MPKEGESFWAWGYADEFPDEDEREELAEFVTTEFGFPERPRLELPKLSSVSIPEPSIEVPSEIASFSSTDVEDRIRHTYGRSYLDRVRGFYENFDPAPDIVSRPTDEADLRSIFECAGRNNVAVVPVGGGSSLVGGTEGSVDGDYNGVISVDMAEFDQVLEVDEVSRSARIQAGAYGPHINDQLKEHGFHLRHYPQSYEFSTLGGWLATHAGGHYATEYTHIDEFAENIRMVSPDATIESRRLPASGAGPDPNEMILGSEGTLGIITEAWMNLVPRPQYTARITMQFDELHSAVSAAKEIVQAGLAPANCRLLDKNHVKLNRLQDDPSHLLLIGFEANDEMPSSDLDRAIALAEREGGEYRDGPFFVDNATEDNTGRSSSEAERRWRQEFFRDPHRTDAFISLGVMRRTFETAVTWDKFDELHDAVITNVMDTMERVCGGGFMAMRFTHVYPDGPAPYYTMLAPVEPGREIEQAEKIKQAGVDTLIEHGGTTTHHHAVGRTHKPWYHEEVPEDFRESLRAMKDEVDPQGIMNPGVLIDVD